MQCSPKRTHHIITKWIEISLIGQTCLSLRREPFFLLPPLSLFSLQCLSKVSLKPASACCPLRRSHWCNWLLIFIVKTAAAAASTTLISLAADRIALTSCLCFVSGAFKAANTTKKHADWLCVCPVHLYKRLEM